MLKQVEYYEYYASFMVVFMSENLMQISSVTFSKLANRAFLTIQQCRLKNASPVIQYEGSST